MRLERHRSAHCLVKHPDWKFQRTTRGIAFTVTPDVIAGRLLEAGMKHTVTGGGHRKDERLKRTNTGLGNIKGAITGTSVRATRSILSAILLPSNIASIAASSSTRWSRVSQCRCPNRAQA